jgi:capsular exopolysaccharide synthesis family protein
MTNQQPIIDLHQYWDVLRARKLAIIIPALAAIALAVLAGFVQKPQYTATAKVLVNPVLTPVPSGNGTPKPGIVDMNTEQATAMSAPVGALVRKKLGITSSNNVRLLGNLNVSAATSGNFLTFQYTSPDPKQAAEYANAFANAYLTYRNNSVLDLLNAAIRDRQHAIALLLQQLPHAGSVTRQALMIQVHEDESQLAAFQSDLKLVSGGQVVSNAVPPASPSSPKLTKNAILAGAVGLILGVILALVREGMDRRIKSPAELASRLQAPTLGVIPRFRAGRGGALPVLTDPRGAVAEAYRMTAVAVETLAVRTGARVIMVTSPEAGGGASTTTANLGVVLAQAGHQVILVSADMRSPTLHLIFDIPHGRGLSTAIVEGKEAERLLKDTRIPNLFLLNAGPEPEDPPALLSSSAAVEVFTTLQNLQPDFILIDAPPVLAASDTMILSRHADAAVVTWNAEAFQVPVLTKARERLDRAGAVILGGVYGFASGRSRESTGGFQPGEPPAVSTPLPAVPAADSRVDPFDPLDSQPIAARPPSRVSGRARS